MKQPVTHYGLDMALCGRGGSRTWALSLSEFAVTCGLCRRILRGWKKGGPA